MQDGTFQQVAKTLDLKIIVRLQLEHVPISVVHHHAFTVGPAAFLVQHVPQALTLFLSLENSQNFGTGNESIRINQIVGIIVDMEVNGVLDGVQEHET